MGLSVCFLMFPMFFVKEVSCFLVVFVYSC